MTCDLYKVGLSAQLGFEEPKALIFWAYQESEAKARDAAIRWAEAQHPGYLVTITGVALIP